MIDYRKQILFLGIALCLSSGFAAYAADPKPQDVDFNRDIRPILSDYCFECHGPDSSSRATDFRLDRKEFALAKLDDGDFAIVPGDHGKSQLYQRITSDDDVLRMPPEDFTRQLSPKQIETLKRWIEGGAKWDEHWSLVPPRRPKLPAVVNKTWPRNPIDRFVLARLEAKKLVPSSETDRVTLIRRLSFDLTGLPPEIKEVEAFVEDKRSDAVERLVERLLKSPHYGERMAVNWLDLVRYADTVGYHGDQERAISPYRDYVIGAFNNNLPFDRFTIEQLAGDLLPGATRDQKIAAGFNMLGMTTIEGGAQAKEYLAKYAADRVRTTAGVWMAATMGCAECHDHKYDPYTMRDFYSLASFFADIQQKGVGNPSANLLLSTPAQERQLAKFDEQIAAAKSTVKKLTAEAKANAEDKTASKEKPSAAEKALEAAKKQLASMEKQRKNLDKSIRKTISPVAGEPRVMRVLGRGDWMDETGEIVQPAVPEYLGEIGNAERRATRLDLANWLVSRDQPQTARVFVNRLWKLYFGKGLSSILDDLGSQGEQPSHPELLDWLAVEFVESGWDVKHLIRLIVTSSTYRQSSLESDTLRKIDPVNRLLARQSRFRIEAEFVRDTVLSIGGLLVKETGGESIRPYQPTGYYAYLNFPKRKYQQSSGSDQYRRGVYMHWQRTFLHPMLLAFDAPSREECTAQRTVSNTPLAALTLLNDPSMVEAARSFAERIVREGGTETDARLTWAWRRTVSRTPSPRELDLLRKLLKQHRDEFAADRKAAETLLATGLSPVAKDMDAVELAAWTSVARAIINLNETITRN